MVTTLHGAEKAAECEKMTSALFKDEFVGLSKEALNEISKSLNKVESDESVELIQALVDTKLASSRREAREFLKANSIRVNGNIINDEHYLLSKDNALENEFFFIKRGKKNYAVLYLN